METEYNINDLIGYAKSSDDMEFNKGFFTRQAKESFNWKNTLEAAHFYQIPLIKKLIDSYNDQPNVEFKKNLGEALINVINKKLDKGSIDIDFITRGGGHNELLDGLPLELQAAIINSSPALQAQELSNLVSSLPNSAQLFLKVAEKLEFDEDFSKQLGSYNPIRRLLELNTTENVHDNAAKILFRKMSDELKIKYCGSLSEDQLTRVDPNGTVKELIEKAEKEKEAARQLLVMQNTSSATQVTLLRSNYLPNSDGNSKGSSKDNNSADNQNNGTNWGQKTFENIFSNGPWM